MTQILFGDRIGKEGKIRLGCVAVLLDEKREKALITRRRDTGQWCLPSGGLEPGESVSEACAREVWEETGLKVRIIRMTSIFSGPDRLVIYEDGNKFQVISLNFEVEKVGGELGLSDETTEAGFFSPAEIEALDVFPHHRQFILDTMKGQDAVFIR
ncbi:MAG TPA: NUDIX domain-containing protein [Anaerolineales bacterium]|nr:NUDIX domain-containing protein [Anaerolineales bacterium]